MEIQRGVVFSLALLLSLNLPDSAVRSEYARRRDALSPYGLDPPDEIGGWFNDHLISELLFESGQKLGYPLKPRQITFPAGYTIVSYNAPEEARLPEISWETYNLAMCAKLGRSLHAQIGAAIDEDLEGAFVAGQRFVSSYGAVDLRLTTTLIDALNLTLPPHMQWLVTSVAHSPEKIATASLIQKIAPGFVGEGDPDGTLFLLFLDRFYSLKSCEGRSNFFEDDPAGFLKVVFLYMETFISLAQAQADLVPARTYLRSQERVPPPSGIRLDQALRATYQDVSEQWGFDLSAGEGGLYLGERLDRRLCGIYSIYRNMILNPSWIRTEDLRAIIP